MSERTIPLLLVAYSARSLVSSARRAELQVAAVDFFADADSREMADVHQVASWGQIPEIAAALRPGAILMGSGFETQPEVVAALREIAPLLNASPASCEACRDPAVWPVLIRRCGFDSPKVITPCDGTVTLSEPENWLIKNRWTAGGTGVREPGAPGSSGERVIPLARGEFLQQRLTGTPCSALFWIGADRICCLGFFRQLCGEQEFGAKAHAYAGAIGPLSVEPQRAERLNQLASGLAREFGLRGVVGVDLIVRGEELLVIEINPRLTATAELWERANPESSLVAGLLSGKLPGENADWLQRPTTTLLQGKAVLYWTGRTPLSIEPSVFQVLLSLQRQRRLADLPALNSTVPTGAPFVTLFTQGTSEAEVMANLKDLAGELRQAVSIAAAD